MIFVEAAQYSALDHTVLSDGHMMNLVIVSLESRVTSNFETGATLGPVVLLSRTQNRG